MTTDRPLGIADLFAVDADARTQTPQLDPLSDLLWYWCRLHERAEWWVDATSRDCVRIGPFMSEREALRLNVHWRSHEPLGMEVER